MLPNAKEIIVYKFPQKLRDELDLYSKEGLVPSAFIGQVLCNNLVLSLVNMNEKQAQHLNEILQYINNELPADSYGSDANVDSWLAWKKDGEKQPLSLYQLKHGQDIKTKIRALESALKQAGEVCARVFDSSNNENMGLLVKKCKLALEGNFEQSLEIKMGL